MVLPSWARIAVGVPRAIEPNSVSADKRGQRRRGRTRIKAEVAVFVRGTSALVRADAVRRVRKGNVISHLPPPALLAASSQLDSFFPPVTPPSDVAATRSGRRGTLRPTRSRPR